MTPHHPVPTPMDQFLHEESRRLGGKADWHGYLLFCSAAPPSIEAVRAHVAATAERVPAWNYRVADRRGRLAWVNEPADDPRAHVHELRLDPGPEDVVGRLHAALQRIPFPPDAPDWGLWLVHGWEPESYALCYRVSHALQDGMGGAATIGALFGPGGPGGPDEGRLHLTVPKEAEPRFRFAHLAAARPAREPRTRHAATRWPLTRRPADEFAALHTAHVEVERLRAIGKLGGATINQVYLATTAGALRAWCPPEWSADAERSFLRAAVPVDTRPEGYEDASLGNHFSALHIALPWAEPDPRARLEAMKHTVRPTREQRTALRSVMRAMPRRVFTTLARSLGERYASDLGVTNIRLPGDLAFGDDPVIASLGMIPLPYNLPLIVGLSTHGPDASILFVCDRAEPDPADLPGLWHAALSELEDAFRDG